MNPHYEFVAARAGHRCEYCHAPEAVFNFAFEIEHIVARAMGGVNLPRNLALACRACNLFKSFHLLGFDEVLQLEVELFHPREQNWDDHFQVDLPSVRIIGLTSTGRATIQRLQMNSLGQIQARQSWMALNLFP